MSLSIDRALVADDASIERTDDPPDPRAIGLNPSSRDWSRGSSKANSTDVSTIYRWVDGAMACAIG
jgi:hypothetical protein